MLESGVSEILVDGERERFWFSEEIHIRTECLSAIALITKGGDPDMGIVN